MVNPRLALRTLFKTPFVTVITVISLALGIGANAAIYSLFDQLLLRPLPVRDPGRLVNLSAPGPKSGSTSCNQAGSCEHVFSYPMFRDLQQAEAGFSDVVGHRAFGANLAYRGQTLNGEGMLVSGNYFRALGLQPALGRLFTPEDDQTIGAHFVTVLSHAYWETRRGASPDVLNQSIVVNGQSMTIVGVAPRGFVGTTLGAEPDVFVPLTMRALMEPYQGGSDQLQNRRAYWVYLFGRLKPGVTLEQAQSAINGIYKPIINDVEAPLQQGMSEPTLERFRAKEIVVSEGQRGQSQIHTEASTPLTLLFSITGIVLLIACANIANLLLARGAGRSMEMAVRLSLGAGRRQLLAQLLTESILLALLGGIVSLAVAQWTLTGIASILPSDASSSLQFRLDPRVIGFAAVLSIGTGLLFGLFPALHSTRPDLVTTLRANTGQPSGARAAARFRTTLVTSQIALSMTLLTLAGLFVKSLNNVSRVDLGMRVENILTFGLAPMLNGYEPERTHVLFNRIEEELAAVPGVTSVTAAMVPLLSGSNWGTSVRVEGFADGPDVDNNSRYNEIGAGYFRTLGIPLVAGREFTIRDDEPAPNVAIVNEAFTRKFNLGADAVGKRMGVGRGDELGIEIVGVVKDAKYSEVKDPVPPLFFRPWRQDSGIGFIQFYVRTATDPNLLRRTITSVVARLDPNLPVEEIKTLPQQVRENVFLDRMISILSASFAVLATLLAAVGLYGVLAYTVAQRTREIGVRMALGADARRVRGLVLRQVAIMTVIGGAIGVGAAIGLGRLAGSLLFGLQGHDPAVLLLAAALLTIVAFAAGGIPAARAARVHPMQALRYE